jgi:Protein of unknown function (DUF2490)
MKTMSRALQLFLQALRASETGRARRVFLLLRLIMLLVCLSGSAHAQRLPPVPEDDTQQWNDIQIAAALNKKVDFNVYTTFRFGRDISHLVDRRIGAGFTFKVGKYVTLAPWYLHIVTRPAEGRKVNENRLNFAATVSVPLGKKLTLTDRNLFERRLRFPTDSTRYRNRLQVAYPVKVGDTALQLFASEEVFYDWSVERWVRNRFAVGVSRKFNQHFTGDLYYMRQNDGVSRPGDLHVIGVTYRIRL